MTSAISAEWNSHQSRFARRWRISMMARKKLIMLTEDQLTSLESRLSQADDDPSLLAIMIKDRLLLEAALGADKRILSIDDRVRHQLRAHIARLPELRSIHWANPCTQDEQVVVWLQAGAPDDRDRQLGRRDEHAPLNPEVH